MYLYTFDLDFGVISLYFAQEWQRDKMEVGLMSKQRSPDNDGTPKRNKRKGASHACNREALDNPDVVAEQGWKEHDEEYWSYKTVKQYVKMYHIGKY